MRMRLGVVSLAALVLAAGTADAALDHGAPDPLRPCSLIVVFYPDALAADVAAVGRLLLRDRRLGQITLIPPDEVAAWERRRVPGLFDLLQLQPPFAAAEAKIRLGADPVAVADRYSPDRRPGVRLVTPASINGGPCVREVVNRDLLGGKPLVYASTDNLYVLDPRHARPWNITRSKAIERDPDWSPDGQHVVAVRMARLRWRRGEIPRRTHADLVVIDVRTGGARLIARVRGNLVSSPVWSPDGGRIAFVRDETVYVIPSAGGELERLTEGTGPSWSPDGGRIVFQQRIDEGADGLFTIGADGSDLRRLTEGGHDPAWSPDGQLVAFAESATAGCSHGHVSVVPAEGGPARRITPCDQQYFRPTWTADGRVVVVNDEDPFPLEASVWVVSPAGDAPQLLLRTPETITGHARPAR
jgi:Tol biopolymer transport system component